MCLNGLRRTWEGVLEMFYKCVFMYFHWHFRKRSFLPTNCLKQTFCGYKFCNWYCTLASVRFLYVLKNLKRYVRGRTFEKYLLYDKLKILRNDVRKTYTRTQFVNSWPYVWIIFINIFYWNILASIPLLPNNENKKITISSQIKKPNEWQHLSLFFCIFPLCFALFVNSAF